MSTELFPWPKPEWAASVPTWTAQGFLIDGEIKPVLEFIKQESGWRDEFTQLVELESGNGENPMDRASRRLALEALRGLPEDLGRQNVILEAGSSSGFLIRDLRQFFPSALIIASDYLSAPLFRLVDQQPGVPVMQFDLRLCPLPDNCTTGFVALNVLEHIDDDETCVRQIHRILRPGGIVHLEVPSGPELYDIYDERFLHKRRYQMPRFTELLRAQGFEIIKATHLGFFVFPYFRHVKRQGQKLMKLSAAQKEEIIARQFQQTTQSRPLAGLLWLELMLGRFFSWPCGVRCVVTARKI